MAFSIALDRDVADFRIVAGRLRLTNGAGALRDRLFTALSTQLGEWFLDETDGVPYYGDSGMLGGKLTQAEVSAILRRRILLDPDVSQIVTLEVFRGEQRAVRVSAQVLSKLGESIYLEV